MSVLEYLENLKGNAPLTALMVMGAAVYKRGLEEEKQSIHWCGETVEFMKEFALLWEGKGAEPHTLKNPETSGLGEVRSLPYERVHEKITAYFGEVFLTE